MDHAHIFDDRYDMVKRGCCWRAQSGPLRSATRLYLRIYDRKSFEQRQRACMVLPPSIMINQKRLMRILPLIDMIWLNEGADGGLKFDLSDQLRGCISASTIAILLSSGNVLV